MTLLSSQLAGLLEQYGTVILFAVITLETLGLPLPGESTIILASAAAGAGKLSIWHVAVAAWAAAVLGDNLGFLIGRRYGRAAILRFGPRLGITPDRYARVEAIARRYGPLMVVAARFVVLLRQLNGLVAGSTGMAWPHFLLANMIGAALWVGLWASVAYQFGHSVSIVPLIWHHATAVASVVVVTLIATVVVLSRHRARV